MHANWPHKINDQINRKRQGLPDAGCQRGATAILLFVCMLSLFSTNCPNIIVLHSANTSELQATKKPHNYHKIAVWQKDDRIRKSPLKFYGYYYSELTGDCQTSIFLSFRCLISYGIIDRVYSKGKMPETVSLWITGALRTIFDDKKF